ncbi:MAG: ATP-dependent RecD-like DNA helicase [Flavobacteriaceae bacterium]|jgi:exodeoxyribonuclease-5
MSLQQHIQKEFPYPPTADQTEAIRRFSAFVEQSSSSSIFLLKGYAGTGKTTLIASWLKPLLKQGYKVVLMAPTGRAVKVMSTYAKAKANTIHKRIYFAQQNKQGGIQFTLQKNKFRKAVFIVDEASMIGDEQSSAQLFQNGSLLQDLISYAQHGDRCKLVFVGDTAQLPPVKQELSPALNQSYLSLHFSTEVAEVELSEVLRQDALSGILHNATNLRNLMHENIDDHFQFLIRNKTDITHLQDGYDIQGAIEDGYRNVGRTETTIIVRSNKRANQYNRQIRTQIMSLENDLAVGDLLLVVKNNYFWLTPDSHAGFIANGDVIEILRILSFQELYGFRFAKVHVQLVDYPDQDAFDTVLILDALDAEGHALTYEQSNELYQKVRQDYSHLPKYKQYPEVKKNPFFNALQVKFAYALTCHKAQGGQWKRVFIEKPYLPEGPSVDYYRWLYTAITRASEHLFLIGFKEEDFDND